MDHLSPTAAAPIFIPGLSRLPSPEPSKAAKLIKAANMLLPQLAKGQRLDACALREAMTTAFEGSDAEGLWAWKDAYDACEVAELLFFRRFLPRMRAGAKSPRHLLDMVGKLTALIPTHTRRSEESQTLQQFSTPPELCLLAATAASITTDDLVLEPSAGTGQLAIMAESLGALLHLNELGETRADLLAELFSYAQVTRFNAEHIHDLLPDEVAPTVVLMNPPFSASPNVSGTFAGVDLKHIRAALNRLSPGGRLVAITSHSLTPDNPSYADAFASLAQTATLQFTCVLDGAHYRRHGTTMETCLTVFDKAPAPSGHRHLRLAPGTPLAFIIDNLHHALPARLPCTPPPVVVRRKQPAVVQASSRPMMPVAVPAPATQTAPELVYDIIEQAPTQSAGNLSESLYEAYAPERIRIVGAMPHPTKLVQSAAMASVRPPVPTYRPHLPAQVVTDGILSDAQLESVVYAGEAHSRHLAGSWLVNETLDVLTAAPVDAVGAVIFRRGWFLGDGTGAGKGRQVSGILLDNWLKGRRKALWISKSDKLLEDAQRDWSALAQEKLLVVPLDRYRQGTPVRLAEGILFTTYATLRSAERSGKASRLQQVLDWVGKDFDGVIIFDEAHAMGNAAGGSSERGNRAASQQGIAGLRLQHALPDARVLYVSATGATTVENLAYAQRLGLWGSDDLPFETRTAFVSAMENGGIASMEVMARDLKTLGLYMSRSLSYEGVEVDILEHQLTPEQIRIYDAYAGAYQIIHSNLEQAMRANNISSESGGTLNAAAKSAARSAFESSKQRFFNHLITAMKLPSLIASIKADLEAGHSAVVQLVSTSEALMERRLAQIPASEWGDLSFDVTPREYVLDYLMHSFPTQLFETYTDDKGFLVSRPMVVDDHYVESREAVERRDKMIEDLAALPPVQSALDQLVHYFGTDQVAEVTGRSRRIVAQKTKAGTKLMVQNRPGSSNLGETQAFMDDKKPILVFSDAGGTGRSYHADLAAVNQRLRVHYLLEAGWKADAAIQGLGRTNRTNQKQPPLFRPVATDVRGEKRFLSTIARRLDSLGAITRGQRQTGGQGMFRASDNLESPYARAALRKFFEHIHSGRVKCCSAERFHDVTGLKLCDADGTLLEELPPISTFLNRVLALQIGLQNSLFEHFEGLVEAQVEGAIAKGTYEVGLETIRAESLAITCRQTISVHDASGATTDLYTVARKDKNHPVSLEQLKAHAANPAARLLVNTQSGRAALSLPAPSLTMDDGGVEYRVRLIRPMERHTMPVDSLEESNWHEADDATFTERWNAEVKAVPEFTTSTFHVITGLLLPIWKLLPDCTPRVYRFDTETGERVIGRMLPVEELHRFTDETGPLSAEDAWARLQAGAAVMLPEGMSLKRVMVMHASRIELIGYHDTAKDRLKAMGMVAEMIAWRLRLFVPTGERGPTILAELLGKYPGKVSHA